MPSRLDELLARIAQLEREVETELNRARDRWKHATRVRGPHAHYREFVDYGDAKGYHRQLPILRDELKGKRSEGPLS